MESRSNHVKRIKKEFQGKVIGYILAAFGLVAGLAWNEAVKASIEYFFPMSQNSLLAKFIYAVLITLVLVLVTIYLTRFMAEEEKEEESGGGMK